MKQKTRFKYFGNIGIACPCMNGRCIGIGPKKAISVDLYWILAAIFFSWNFIYLHTSTIKKNSRFNNLSSCVRFIWEVFGETSIYIINANYLDISIFFQRTKSNARLTSLILKVLICEINQPLAIDIMAAAFNLQKPQLVFVTVATTMASTSGCLVPSAFYPLKMPGVRSVNYKTRRIFETWKLHQILVMM